MSAGRALQRVVRRRPDEDGSRPDPAAPAVSWGRIGTYDAVSRGGFLFLLAPQPGHPARRVRAGA